jgi:NAD(P)-dependent dehydrogenase (short-subunit alcohol dehydrogenase family)
MTTRTWFITGTSSGFGRILTKLLLERGDRVAATARKPETLNDLTAQYPDRLWTAALDVTDTDAVRRVIDEAFAVLGRIDVVVNNAGYGLLGAAEELRDDQIIQQIDTNLIGSIQVTRAAIPHLREQGGGRIIQISSLGGQVAFPAVSLYSASKWGIEGFFESVIPEIAPFGIQVTIVEPGSAHTEFAGGSMAVSDRMDVYDETPVANIREMRRRMIAGELKATGDPVKMVRAIIASADAEKAPRRLPLGSDAYQMIHAALTERLVELEAQKDVAHSTDADAM